MEVRACRECRRLFNYLAGDYICPECTNKLEEKFHEVREYIVDHSGAGMKQVSKDCDVALPQIKKWIMEERLHLADEKEVYSICEGCGGMIPSGNFCNICKSQFINEIGRALKSDKMVEKSKKNKKDIPKMRFIRH